MKPHATGAWVLIGLGAVLVLVLLLCRSASVEAAYPVENASNTFRRRVWTRVTGFFRGASASAENVRLKQELAGLTLVRSDLRRLEEENARLRRALGYAERRPGVWLPACVLSSRGGAVAARDTVRVDKGSLAGVREGAVVSVPEGVVGRVSHVTPHTAEVLLVTDARQKVPCEIVADAARPLRGILCGGSEDLLELRYLNDADRAPPRARVITSGRGGVYPRGLEVGTYVDGRVEPSVVFSALEDVFIRCEK